MTQRQRVLKMLKEAGPKGIRSDKFFEAYLPRAAARILELKQEGYEITSEHVHPFVVYRLVEVGAGAEAEEPRRPGHTSVDLSESKLVTGPSPSPVGDTEQGACERSPETLDAHPLAQLFDPAEARTRPLSAFTDAEAA